MQTNINGNIDSSCLLWKDICKAMQQHAGLRASAGFIVLAHCLLSAIAAWTAELFEVSVAFPY